MDYNGHYFLFNTKLNCIVTWDIQGGAKVITLLENATTFPNGAKCQFCFDIFEVSKRRI